MDPMPAARPESTLRRRLRLLARTYDRWTERLGLRVRNSLPTRRTWISRPKSSHWQTGLLNVEGQWVRHHRRSASGTSQGTLVFVHGWGMAARSFEPLTELFSDDHDLVLIDLPGFAGLPHPAEPSMEGYGRAVAGVADELGLTDVTIVGHSTGCNVAIEAARTMKPAALVLISPPDVRPSLPVTTLRFARIGAREPLKVKAWAFANYCWAGVHWALEVVPLLLDYPAAEALAEVDVPTLVLQGEYDPLSPRDWARTLHEASGSITRVVPGAGHSIIIVNAPKVAAQMRHVVR